METECIKTKAFKPRRRVTCNAGDPHLIGREVIWQDCDWPHENLVSVPVNQRKLRNF